MVVSVVAVRNGAGEVVRNLDHHWERLFDPLTTHRGTRAGTTLDAILEYTLGLSCEYAMGWADKVFPWWGSGCVLV